MFGTLRDVLDSINEHKALMNQLKALGMKEHQIDGVLNAAIELSKIGVMGPEEAVRGYARGMRSDWRVIQELHAAKYMTPEKIDQRIWEVQAGNE